MVSTRQKRETININGKPVFGPERPPKKTKNNPNTLKKFLIEDWFPSIKRMVEKAGGVKEFLEKYKELAPEFKKIAEKRGDKVAEWGPKVFPELGLKKEDIKKSYKNQIKIYDDIISSNKENIENDTELVGKDGNNQSE